MQSNKMQIGKLSTRKKQRQTFQQPLVKHDLETRTKIKPQKSATENKNAHDQSNQIKYIQHSNVTIHNQTPVVLLHISNTN